MEAEYIMLSDAAYEGRYWLMICKTVAKDITRINMFTDNTAAKCVAEGSGQVRKVKHLETHFQIIHQMVPEGQVNLTWVSMKDNIADIFTKHIGDKKTFIGIRDKILERV
jgi:hypothetical protein